ncbi:MAG: DEAD/DEAH box helicase [Caldilineaceae bacterium]|nr:DEAD/DEAH box helicase [Caldilineaceae bacterium]
MPFVLHAAWIRSDEPVPNGQLFFWADDSSRPLPTDTPAGLVQPAASRSSEGRPVDSRVRSTKAPSHPSQISVGQLRAQLLATFPTLNSQELELYRSTIWLPEQQLSPFAVMHPLLGQSVSSQVGTSGNAQLHRWQITGLAMAPTVALRFLCRLAQDVGQPPARSNTSPRAAEQQISNPIFTTLRFGNDLLFWSNAAKYTLQMLARQQYLPTLLPQSATHLYAGWQPIFTENQVERQFEQLCSIMPPACRAYGLSAPADAPSAPELLTHFVTTLLDGTIRAWGQKRLPIQAPSTQSQQWLQSLTGEHRGFDLSPQAAHQIYQIWRSWSEQLHITRDANFRICFKLEPPTVKARDDATTGVAGAENWTLHYYLQARDQLHLLLPAAEVWDAPAHTLHLGSRLLDRPKERLLAGLTVAARISPPIARSLQTPQPSLVHLTTAEAYAFLNETAALLESSGFGIQLPAWWHTSQRIRLGLRMNMLADEGDVAHDNGSDRQHTSAPTNHRGPGYVRYDWELMLGDKPLSRDEFERLAALDTPLVHLREQWIELDPNQVAAAQQFLAGQHSGGRVPFLQALRIAQSHAARILGNEGNIGETIAGESFLPAALVDDGGSLADTQLIGGEPFLQGLFGEQQVPAVAGLLPILNMNVQGWLADALARLHDHQPFHALAEPENFAGELRPYQRRGVGWLNYLGQLGLGACLADDMGLGKTVQAIALLLHQREQQEEERMPSLLLCPTSVVANWRHEVERFAPTLRSLVHHGSNRLTGDEFTETLANRDLVITSYGTARRDIELLGAITWQNLILDEAQNIKNPGAKQTKAVRQFQAHNRIALTGTPVENRLAELWSIMEFLNPGYLEGYGRFRRRYVIPIERYNDEQQAAELRNLVQPFLLRRLKSDPTIIADLPEKNEMVVYCSLSQEQATLYEKVVRESLAALDQSDGIQRRGMVLALLTKLKQICNHPAHYLKEDGPIVGRSGKVNRLTEMMEEVIDVGDSALVFTQFVEMGELLQKHFTEQLKADVLFLHGRTTAAQRERMVQTFQESEAPTIFLLSLRAGGSGLNLTKANHVFHFDRWWNPAVENQATDRAFRIGQRRDVQVHKFVVAGTLEEHIQHLLDEKQNLADTIVGSGEQWLSELNTEQLRELLLLRRDERVVAEPGAPEEEEF